MLTRVLLPRGATVSVGRLFATSIPRWNVPTSVEGTVTAPLDANAIKAQIAQLKVAQQSIEKERIAATVVARKARKIEFIAKRKAKIAQLRARAVANKEQAATRAATESARKEQAAARVAEVKGKRVEMMKERRDRKEKNIANRKEKRAQLRARAVARKEQAAIRATTERARAVANKEKAATRAATESAKAKATASLLKTKPWRKQGKLPARPFAVYLNNHGFAMQPGEKLGVAMKRIQSQFKALTAEQRLPYEEKAAANLKVREAALAKIQGLKISGYILFFKTNYKEVAASIPDAPIVEGAVVDRKAVMLAKGPKITKAIGEKWKALSPEEQAAYKVKAADFRAEAEKNLSEMA